MFPSVSRLAIPESTNRYYLDGEVLIRATARELDVERPTQFYGKPTLKAKVATVTLARDRLEAVWPWKTACATVAICRYESTCLVRDALRGNRGMAAKS